MQSRAGCLPKSASFGQWRDSAIWDLGGYCSILAVIVMGQKKSVLPEISASFPDSCWANGLISNKDVNIHEGLVQNDWCSRRSIDIIAPWIVFPYFHLHLYCSWNGDSTHWTDLNNIKDTERWLVVCCVGSIGWNSSKDHSHLHQTIAAWERN